VKPALILLLVLVTGCARRTETPTPRGKVSAEVADRGPRLVGNPPNLQIELPPRMTQALARSDSGFVTLTPFDFVADIVPGDTTSGAWRYPYDGRQAPFAVIGDFDGDGRDDVALLQRATESAPFRADGRVVVVFDRASTPFAPTATSWNSRIAGGGVKCGFYLTRFRKGPFKPPDWVGAGDTSHTINMPYEGIEVSNFGKTAMTFWWTPEGDFDEVRTAD
jgi:hypothetical protein